MSQLLPLGTVLRSRYKTVELIIEEMDWEPPAANRQIKGSAIAGVRIDLTEKSLQNRVRKAGGKWNRDKMLWEIDYDKAVQMGLEERIVGMLDN